MYIEINEHEITIAYIGYSISIINDNLMYIPLVYLDGLHTGDAT